ncbi:MAG: serine/threonine-protein kinase [Blastocatellia bacterium]
MLELRTGIEIKEKYVIHEPAGTGGSASVWKAYDKNLKRFVALKRLLKPSFGSNKELSDQMKSEAQRHAQLTHTNIVTLYELFEEQGEHLMVMEYVNGQPLNELLREKALNNELLPLDVAVDLLRYILEGVSFAHNIGICHRDLSPMNVLLTAQGVPKIADFGIARAVTADEPDEPQGGTGTPNYMSPEQARGEPADFHPICS